MTATFDLEAIRRRVQNSRPHISQIAADRADLLAALDAANARDVVARAEIARLRSIITRYEGTVHDIAMCGRASWESDGTEWGQAFHAAVELDENRPSLLPPSTAPGETL